MKPENLSVNPNSKATLQFSVGVIEDLDRGGFKVTHLVMSHNLDPKPGEPPVVITYQVMGPNGEVMSMSFGDVLNLALSIPDSYCKGD